METECLLQVFIRPDESLIIFVPAVHTGYSIIKAWGYVLIILLNSDEILKRSPLGSHHQQMKQSFAQLASSGSHVFLHLFRIFQFEAQQAKSGIKDYDKKESGGGRERGRGGGEREIENTATANCPYPCRSGENRTLLKMHSDDADADVDASSLDRLTSHLFFFFEEEYFSSVPVTEDLDLAVIFPCTFLNIPKKWNFHVLILHAFTGKQVPLISVAFPKQAAMLVHQDVSNHYDPIRATHLLICTSQDTQWHLLWYFG